MTHSSIFFKLYILVPRVVPALIRLSDETTDEDEDKARTYFPESWIWTLLQSK